jgi:pimeloyl-ACP methyl ester carboxylesterase
MSVVAPEKAGDNTTIRPFHVNVPEAELTELRKRIKATRWPERETVADHSQGVPLATIQKLARYWGADYDWRRIEAKLNTYPQFITQIDGLDFHFVHVRSKHGNALPILITHGWPGSITHFLQCIEPLANPTAHGGSAADAFHVVIPSLPGYGFSAKPSATGWDPSRIARAWAALMDRLGYAQYVAQGGDWGAIITDLFAMQRPPGLIGIHTNMPGAVPPEVDAAAFSGGPMPPGLAPDEEIAFEQLCFVYKHVYYALYMGSRPQTLTGFADSPIGLAAFLLDLEARGLNLIERIFDGQPESLTRDDVLDNISVFWLTNTAISAARLYWENKHAYFVPKNVTLPVAVSVFPDELYQAPRSWVERAYPNLIHYNRLEKGGHFPAWEQPQLFVQELRVGFQSLRSY